MQTVASEQVQLNPRQLKRPRFITAGLSETPDTKNHSKSQRFTPPRLTPDLLQNSPRPPKADQICAFCKIKGSVPECEGELLGPFTLTTKNKRKVTKFYAHKLCALWAPDAFEMKNGTFVGVDIALSKARKCHVCGDRGASLGCMYRGKRCCRPYHFRCALRSGASIMQEFKFHCHLHTDFSLAPSKVIRFQEITSLGDNVLRYGNTCTRCDGDSYDFSKHGNIMSCNTCLHRMHTRCVSLKPLPSEYQSSLLINCFKGSHYCEKCMVCSECERPVDQRAYKISRRRAILRQSSDIDIDAYDQQNAEDCNLLLCISCNHFAIHIDCLDKNADKRQWRCNVCRVCIQCKRIADPGEEWNEYYQSCGKCSEEIRNGAVVCPVCRKIYRDGEDGAMIQCDGCEKWIHALTCGDLTSQQFAQLGKDSKKYFCPLCVEKKRYLQQKKRRNAEYSEGRFLLRGKSASAFEKAVLKRIPPPSDEHAYYSIQPISKDDNDVVTKALTELAIDTDICRRCCSGSVNDVFRYCITCGDSFHEFCSQGKFGAPFSTGASEHNAWQCAQCRMNWDAPGNLTSIVKTNGVLNNPDSIKPITMNGSAHKPDLFWEDERRCELCNRGERKNGPEGRLVVWSSSMNNDLNDCWVHIGCVLWSVGMTLHQGEDFSRLIMGQRRALLTSAKRTRCSRCGETGATIKCSTAGCRKMYHFHCAGAAGFACVVISSKGGKPKKLVKKTKKQTDSEDSETIMLVCKKHAEKESVKGRRISFFDAHKKNQPTGMVRVLDSQGYVVNPDAGQKRVVSMNRSVRMRVGPLTVMRFGEIIPDVNDFIVDGCLVPLGYSVARRFWSMKNVGKQCTYFMEVGGHALTGPQFIIRSSENPNLHLSGIDLDSLWASIWHKAMKVQLGQEIEDKREMCRSGLEMFGLDNCESIVRHIESLPLAGMFKGRYTPRWNVKSTNNEIAFYDAMTRKYVAPKIRTNKQGCARVEGYRGRLRKNTAEKSWPSYDNIRSGCAFQLEVAREILFDRGAKQRLSEQHRSVAIAGTCEKNKDRPLGRTRRSVSVIDSGGGMNSGSSSACDSVDATGSGANRKRKRRRTGTGGVEEDGEDMPVLEEEEEKLGVSQGALGPLAKSRTKILRSEIDGWGVFANKDIGAGEIIIEYVGELIRPPISDVRERRYLNNGVGCYMFEVVPGEIVDATMRGNAARYINHSCAPNCFSKTVWTEARQKQVVAIFSKRRIQRGEELSYDYQFPYDDSDRVVCGCGAPQCKGFMN